MRLHRTDRKPSHEQEDDLMMKRKRLYATALAAIVVALQLAQAQQPQGAHELGSLAATRAINSKALSPSLRFSAVIKPALPLVMASHTLMRAELEPMSDPCASVTLDVYDSVYALVKR